MTGNGINQHTDEDGVNQVHGEFGTFCHSAGHDGGSRCAEYSLEYQETFRGKPAAVVEREVEEMGHSYESACTEHQSETDEPVEQAAKHEVNEVLHQDIGRIFYSGETGFDQCKARLHEEYQHGCKQHPYSVQSVGQFTYRIGSGNGCTVCG